MAVSGSKFGGKFNVTAKVEKTSATLIRTSRLSETSLIVHWCGAECGLLKTVAKGATRPGSPFLGKLDLFFECELIYTLSKTSDLHTLKEVEVLNPREGIRRSYLATLTGAYFVRWMEIVAERETAIPELADLLTRGLNFLDREAPSERAVRHFERQLAEIAGVLGPDSAPARDLERAYGTMPVQRKDLLLKLAES